MVYKDELLGIIKELHILTNSSKCDSKIAGELKRIVQYLMKVNCEAVDVREFCLNYNQALCITDGEGYIQYMNEQYMRDTGLDEHIIGKKEPYNISISKQVIASGRTISFGNNGLKAPNKKSRFVTGVPIFDRDHNLTHVVITLAPESEIFRRFQEMKKLVSEQNSVRIFEEGNPAEISLLGKAPAIKEVRGLIRKVAITDATALICGESGTGKEVVANCIQQMSRRSNKPYVRVNCAAIPANMLEAELFGYEKGAFTGAVSRKLGLFEVANHGTIFLDEIGDFPLELQPKLLRTLQQGEIYRIGSTQPVRLDVRVIAATNADLKESVREGKFRKDLYYRINVFPISLPPVRERLEDIRGLIQHFLYEYGEHYGRMVQMQEANMELLEEYNWPGNVRELQNLVEYYVICSEENALLDKNELLELLQRNGLECDNLQVDRLFEKVENTLSDTESGGNADDEQLAFSSQTGDEWTVEDRKVIPEENKMDYLDGKRTLFELRDEFEKHLIEAALKKTGNANKAAKLLGIYPSSLYRKAQKYHLPYLEED